MPPPHRLAIFAALLWRPPRPRVTLALGALVTVPFLLLEVDGGTSDPVRLQEFGSLQGTRLWMGETYRLFSSLFLHAGWFHFGLNLFGLLLIGAMLERRIGSLLAGTIYAVAGVGGNVVYLLVRSWDPCVGASGAIYGWVGALLATDRPFGSSEPVRLGRRFWRISLILFLFDVGLAWIVGLPIAPEAHWGGYAGGVIVVWLVHGDRYPRRVRIALGIVGVVLLLGGAVYVQQPVLDPDYHLYLADWTYLRDGAVAARPEYERLADRGFPAAIVRLALLDHEAGRSRVGFERLDSLPGEGEAASVAAADLRIALLDALGDRSGASAAFEARAESIGEEGEQSIPERLLADNNFAMLCADHRRRLDEGYEAILGVVLRYPDPTFQDTFGWVEVCEGRPRRGIVALERAYELHPISEIGYHLAEAHAALGNTEQARAYLDVALDPDRNAAMGHAEMSLLFVVRARRLRESLAGAASGPVQD